MQKEPLVLLFPVHRRSPLGPDLLPANLAEQLFQAAQFRIAQEGRRLQRLLQIKLERQTE